MVVLSHPTGNPNVRSDLRALEHAGCLEAFYTTVAVPRFGAQHRALPMRVRQRLARRFFAEVAPSKVVTAPARELVRMAAGRLGLGALTRHEFGWACVHAIYQALDRRLARHLEAGRIRASTVYAYEDGALETFRAARGRGMRRVYHLPSAYWRYRHELLVEERERRPDWAPTMKGLVDSAAKHRRKDLELAGADCAIVPSSFVRASLACCPEPPGRIEIVPYGAPVIPDGPKAISARRGQPLRALFVGNLSQLKGLADLHEAMVKIRELATLTLIGKPAAQDCRALQRVIQSHRWLPSVPHARVLELMTEHDVLVLPSIAEGFGLVITEALSRGLPVIATSHTGAADLLTDGQGGFIVPIRSPETIADRLVRLAEDRDLLARMSQAALETARHNPWERYEERIVQIVTGKTVSAPGAVAA